MTATETAASEIVAPTAEATEQQPAPFYGWRYVKRPGTSGWMSDAVPLTWEDVLHPQEGDQVTHTPRHQRICNYVVNVCTQQTRHDPSAVVLNDVRVDWGVPGLKAHGPDIAVIFGVQDTTKNWGTFYAAHEGTRPLVVFEITSPSYREQDLYIKLEEYDLGGLQYYLIIDIVTRGEQEVPRLLGYRHNGMTFVPMTPDARGRLWLEPLRIAIGFEGDELLCYDTDELPFPDYTELADDLDAESQARIEAEQRADAADQRADAEAQARADLEAQMRAMQEELRRLRG